MFTLEELYDDKFTIVKIENGVARFNYEMVISFPLSILDALKCSNGYGISNLYCEGNLVIHHDPMLFFNIDLYLNVTPDIYSKYGYMVGDSLRCEIIDSSIYLTKIRQ